MNTKALIQYIVEHTGHPAGTVREVLRAAVAGITESLAGRTPVRLTGLGRFSTRFRKGRVIQHGPGNLISGNRTINIPDCHYVQFKPSNTLKRKTK